MLKQTTTNGLIAHFKSLQYTVHDHEARTSKEHWTLSCPKQHEPFKASVNSLIQAARLGNGVCCATCKRNVKVNKFLEKNYWEALDGETAQHLRCTNEDCGLTIRYNGNYYDFFRCYCRGSSRAFEHAAFKHLSKAFPGAYITKEYLTPAGHKVDIYIKTDSAEYFIEVDDSSHFSAKSTARTISDQKQRDWFISHNEKNPESSFFIRIPNACVTNPKVYSKIKNHSSSPFLLFKLGTVNRYRNMGFPESTQIQCCK